MESTIILKSDALNALRAAHRLMQEISSQSESSVESYHFERGFSAALSTIATVFGLELEIGPESPVAGAGWRIAKERALSILDSQNDALDWPGTAGARSAFGAAGRR
jgi:hypothetical protein